jgi:hypothetical protein
MVTDGPAPWAILCGGAVLFAAVFVARYLLDKRGGAARSGGSPWLDISVSIGDSTERGLPLGPGPLVPHVAPEKFGFELIRETDPDFDEQDFRDRVAWMFVKVHHALTDQSLERIREFTDDRAMLALQRRIEGLSSKGHVRLFKNLRIDSIRLISVKRVGETQQVVLHIVAKAAPSVVERASGRLVLPDTNGDGITLRRFTEAWVLSRPVGTRTAVRPPLHKCPFCGGPVEENKRYVCTYCGTDLRGPEREWTILSAESG